MKRKKQSPLYFLLIGVLIVAALAFSYKNATRKLDIEQFDISHLSSEQVVIPYLKENHRLPDYYITKKEARKSGWKPERGNLCDVLPGKIIGGDIFSNRENSVPYKKGRKWFEADLNYNCGNRGTDRVVFSDDGLIFVSHNHYNTFEQR
ncbi:MAG: ribonuclease [Flavobacteriaceae bacterium]|nr:ribonuclease [Flavobacteriaceae bacterium]